MSDTGKAWAVALEMIHAKREVPSFESCPYCQNPMTFDAMSGEYYCRCGATASPMFFDMRRRT